MPFVMKAADLVICRSGSMTISEICEVGIASILIPSPNVTANHQFLNAKLMEDRGAGILIEEKNMNEKELILAINRLKNDEFDRKTRAKNSKALSTPNSAKKIIKELFTLKNQ
jgi:UDP-N-acetylglucosamine--N-acetylmuramyl-(pentapeptide) pyrophosphoryl-undecaprenol N-acetylglucosamine transferase